MITCNKDAGGEKMDEGCLVLCWRRTHPDVATKILSCNTHRSEGPDVGGANFSEC